MFGKEPADRGIEESDAGGLAVGEARVVMLCAESNMPLVSRQERNGEVLAQCTVEPKAICHWSVGRSVTERFWRSALWMAFTASTLYWLLV